MAALVELSTHDPERALPTLKEYFPGVTMTNPHGDFALELVAAEVATHSLIKYRLKSPSSSSSADMSETYTFGQISGGTLGLTTSREQFDTTMPWLFPDLRVHADWDDVTITALTISRAAATQMARAHLGSDTADLTFLSNAPVDALRGRAWAALVDFTGEAMTEPTHAFDSPLVRVGAFAHLVGLMLETFPNTITERSRSQVSPVVTPAAVRRAVGFIDQNAHLPITAEDIARESRLSVRTLQYAFRRYLDTTPVAYLRRVRLAGAHGDLQSADPTTGATVASIANAWGFAHPGRFATQYREAYGHSPRRTLES